MHMRIYKAYKSMLITNKKNTRVQILKLVSNKPLKIRKCKNY